MWISHSLAKNQHCISSILPICCMYIRPSVYWCHISLPLCNFFAVEYSQVDWHEFVLVETVNFRETETGKCTYTVFHQEPAYICTKHYYACEVVYLAVYCGVCCRLPTTTHTSDTTSTTTPAATEIWESCRRWYYTHLYTCLSVSSLNFFPSPFSSLSPSFLSHPPFRFSFLLLPPFSTPLPLPLPLLSFFSYSPLHSLSLPPSLLCSLLSGGEVEEIEMEVEEATDQPEEKQVLHHPFIRATYSSIHVHIPESGHSGTSEQGTLWGQ